MHERFEDRNPIDILMAMVDAVRSRENQPRCLRCNAYLVGFDELEVLCESCHEKGGCS